MANSCDNNSCNNVASVFLKGENEQIVIRLCQQCFDGIEPDGDGLFFDLGES